jgi:hypothetical protein
VNQNEKILLPFLFQSFNGGTNMSIDGVESNNIFCSPPITPRVLVVKVIDVNNRHVELTKTHIVVCPRTSVIDRTFRVCGEKGKPTAALDVVLLCGSGVQHESAGEGLLLVFCLCKIFFFTA